MTVDTPASVAAASHCPGAAWRSGFRYVKAGVRLNDMCAAARPAMMDQLNVRLGRGTVFMAAVGIERGWRHHATFHSPRYTTRFGELPIARG